MLRQSNRNFGARPIWGKRLHCDFSAMRRSRPEPVKINHAGSRILSRPVDFTRAAPGKRHIRSCWIEDMRSGLNETQTWKRLARVRQRRAAGRLGLLRLKRVKSAPASKARARRGFTCDFFLFYLTGPMIFVNRHGLLKKFDSAQAAETLSAVERRL